MPRAGPACTQTVWAPHPRHVWLCFPQTCNAGCPISTALKTRLRAVSQSSLGCLEPMTEIRPPQRESLKCLGACSEGRSSDVTAHQVGLKSAFPPGPLGPEQVLFSSAVTASAGPSPPPCPPLPPPHAQVWTVPGHLVWAGGQRGANPAGSPVASVEWPGRAALICSSLLIRAPCLEPPDPQSWGATGGMAAPPAPQVAAEGALLPSLHPGASIRAGRRWWWWGRGGSRG